ncbi:DHS-like NAD/FAD-binding domain-containing protein [Pavlovales sp. CCMP2436]|nr:DHS-like NAD/FAD-binding domain-containing protein [Pavlovales sp. CCMP2436]|mmetsp:Transcript_14520/g.34509  ORF Transcript_14520/g.34509 Transcript_14520/m.34509 type:complete len:298 (+) Transcript_14520:129-1022(+)
MLPGSLSAVASLLLRCRSVGVLSGAGASVAAGIPDFRSPTGMYATLPVDQLTCTERQHALIRADPTCVVERGMFGANQFTYLEVRRPFILGTHESKWKATAAHLLFERLHALGKLRRLYTQNIDGLDLQTQIPRDKIDCVHGTLGRALCEACESEADHGRFAELVRANIKDIYDVNTSAPPESSHITCSACGRPTVELSTVLFGSPLPEEFFERLEEDIPALDLLLIVGTFLVVSPSNRVAALARCTRVVINNEPVGHRLALSYGELMAGEQSASQRDIFLQGECEAICSQQLARLQ